MGQVRSRQRYEIANPPFGVEHMLTLNASMKCRKEAEAEAKEKAEEERKEGKDNWRRTREKRRRC